MEVCSHCKTSSVPIPGSCDKLSEDSGAKGIITGGLRVLTTQKAQGLWGRAGRGDTKAPVLTLLFPLLDFPPWAGLPGERKDPVGFLEGTCEELGWANRHHT